MNNDDISLRIRQIRESLGLNQSEFSRELGIPRSTLVGYETSSTIPAELVSELSRKYDISEAWILSGVDPMKKDRRNIPPFAMQNFPTKNGEAGVPIISGAVPDGLIIPYLEQPVSAGPGASLEEVVIPDRFLTVPKELARYKALSALPVRGDSMSPTLHEGDLVVCDSCGWDGDGVYVIRSNESSYVKRVVQTSKGYTVISDNKAYPAYSESKDDIMIVGKVRCAVIKLE